MPHLRGKINAVVARGGWADKDAPLDAESVRYRVSVAITEEEEFETGTHVSSRSRVDNVSALQAFGTGDPQPGTLVRSPDPAALVQQQLALAVAPAHNPSSASAEPAPAAMAAPARLALR